MGGALQDTAAEEIRDGARNPNSPEEMDELLEVLGEHPIVLLGEASHGNTEYYRWRARITAELIRRYDYDFIAVEGDWTPCYSVNEFVTAQSQPGSSPLDALKSFERWPTWMWGNWEVADFLEWLHTYNSETESEVGFYGLDLYALFESMRAVVDYLEDVDPGAAERAREAYSCFEPYGQSGTKYAHALRFAPESCEDEVVEVLTDLRTQAWDSYETDSEDQLWAEQNARVVKNAESYYRTMVKGGEDSWNVRDHHMADTYDRLLEHYGPDARGIVWAHNTHVGDARATDMTQQGRINIGQLLRERHGQVEVEILGFGGFEGQVIAGDAWDAPAEIMRVPQAQQQSIEGLFHAADTGDCLVFTEDLSEGGPLDQKLGHRAIGVVYNPEVEFGNYVPTNLTDRYDAFIHLETVEELHPLDMHPDKEKVPELFPEGV